MEKVNASQTSQNTTTDTRQPGTSNNHRKHHPKTKSNTRQPTANNRQLLNKNTATLIQKYNRTREKAKVPSHALPKHNPLSKS
jgi:hypothetical protein